mgnify:FL=1
MSSFLVSLLSGPLAQVLTPIATLFIGRALLNAHDKVDALPAAAKQGVIVVVAGLLTSLQSVLGVEICGGKPCSLETLAVPTLAAAAISFILHSALKRA